MVKLKEKLMLALLILWAACIAMLFTIQKAGAADLELRNYGCALNVPINFYPYELKYHAGSLYVSTIGGNAGGNGNASLFKINPKTCAISGSYNAGPYFNGSAYINGLLGFTNILNKAYVIHNRLDTATTQIDVVDTDTLTLVSTVPLGAGTARNVVTDGVNLFVAVEGQNKLKKIDASTLSVTDVYSYPAASKPFRTSILDGVVITTLFDAGKIYFNSTADGSLLASITTEAGAKPNWINDNTWQGVFVGYYGTHKAVKVNMASYTIERTYTLPAADYPHEAYPVMGKQLWVGGTTSPTSYIRVFDIASGAYLGSIARNANIPKMAFDGGAIWSISANNNMIQRNVLDMVQP